MTPALIGKTTFLFAAIVLCAVCVWYNDKLVAFEKKVYEVACDRIGYIAAKIYLGVTKVRINRLIKSTEALTKRAG